MADDVNEIEEVDEELDDDAPVALDVEADAPPPPQEMSWRIGRDLTRRLDQYLVDRIGYLSRNEIQRLISEGCVTVNGKVGKASYRPRENDFVVAKPPPPKKREIEPEPIPLEIVYEDEHLLALNKQADLIVHPARGRWHGTLVNGLVHYANQWSQVNGPQRPGILHRLDRNTTGLMLVAKTDTAHWRLARQFEQRTIQKTYMALAHGVPPLLADVIDMPIGPDRYVRERMAVRKIVHGGKTAVTQYEVLEKYDVTPERAGLTLHTGEHEHDQNFRQPAAGFSLFRLKPQTGRTHQLRVHLATIGFPIVGDTMYGGRVVELPDGTRFARQALHAAELTFTHPTTLKPMTLSAPLPADVEQVLAAVRRGMSADRAPIG